MTQFSLCQIFKFAFSCAFPPRIPFSRPEWDSTYLEPLLALILVFFLCVITTWPAILKRAVQNFAGRVRFPHVNSRWIEGSCRSHSTFMMLWIKYLDRRKDGDLNKTGFNTVAFVQLKLHGFVVSANHEVLAKWWMPLGAAWKDYPRLLFLKKFLRKSVYLNITLWR